eukprot:26457-Prymnesium_polylepis.1
MACLREVSTSRANLEMPRLKNQGVRRARGHRSRLRFKANCALRLEASCGVRFVEFRAAYTQYGGWAIS